jgi:hypothetical protein
MITVIKPGRPVAGTGAPTSPERTAIANRLLTLALVTSCPELNSRVHANIVGESAHSVDDQGEWLPPGPKFVNY